MKKILCIILVVVFIIMIFRFNSISFAHFSDNVNIMDRSYIIPFEYLEEGEDIVVNVYRDYVSPSGSYRLTLPTLFCVRMFDLYIYFDVLDSQFDKYVNYIISKVDDHSGYIDLPLQYFSIGLIVEDGYTSFVSAFQPVATVTSFSHNTLYINHGGDFYTIDDSGGIIGSAAVNNFARPFYRFFNNVPIGFVFQGGDFDLNYFNDRYKFVNFGEFDPVDLVSVVEAKVNSLGDLPELPDRSDFDTDLGFIGGWFKWLVDEIVYLFRCVYYTIGVVL